MFSEIIIGLLALIVGYSLGKVGVGLERSARERARKREEEGLSYIKGVNYILSDAPDLAIEEFIKAVQINSETVETYLALGSLFRSKGDVGRAIRIHQGIICRPQVDVKIMVQAIYELGLDYKKSGLLDRAIATFQDVINRDPKMAQAHVQLEELYEEVKDWEGAFKVQEKLSRLRKSDDRHILAHMMTELGKAQVAKGDRKTARGLFKKAISLHSQCVDAYLHFGDLYAEENQDDKAVAMWKKVMEVSPEMTFLAHDRLEHAFFRMGQVSALEDFLRERSAGEADLVTRIFLARHLRKKGEMDEAGRMLKGILDQWPSSREARQELIHVLVAQGRNDEALAEHENLIASLHVADRHFLCQACGYKSAQLLWKCPQCRKWDTMASREEGVLHGGQEP